MYRNAFLTFSHKEGEKSDHTLVLISGQQSIFLSLVNTVHPYGTYISSIFSHHPLVSFSVMYFITYLYLMCDRILLAIWQDRWPSIFDPTMESQKKLSIYIKVTPLTD